MAIIVLLIIVLVALAALIFTRPVKPIIAQAEGRTIRAGERFVRLQDPDDGLPPTVISPSETGHSCNVLCDAGRNGVALRAYNNVVRVRWDSQTWTEEKSKKQVVLGSFEGDIHAEYIAPEGRSIRKKLEVGAEVYWIAGSMLLVLLVLSFCSDLGHAGGG